MSQISIFVTMTAKSGKGDDLVAALEPLVDAVAGEAGTVHYSLCRNAADGDKIHFVEVYADQAAFTAHATNPKLGEVMGGISELLDGSPEMVMANVVASKA